MSKLYSILSGDTNVTSLSRGSTGSEVETVQMQLNKFGYGLRVDGYFGPTTQNAVIDFQKRFGLQQDGIVGNETETALVKTIAGVPAVIPSVPIPQDWTVASSTNIFTKPGYSGYPLWAELAVVGVASLVVTYMVENKE